MVCEISISPARSLLLTVPEEAEKEPWAKRIENSFLTGQAAGLFALAANKLETPISPSISYWRDYASRYLSQLCKTPEFYQGGKILTEIEPPEPAELEAVLLSVPPMRGAEYLTVNLLVTLWKALDAWVRDEVAGYGEGLDNWLKKHAPIWHQIGRVCFHLAENKRDTDYPFAFMATYAPRLSSGGKVQYQPLSRALEEHAGERDKKGLISLLSPVHMASEKSSFVKELVESNEIFHPLMWTPADAYRFLKDVSLLEDSGVLVRLPDWWRKRARPRVTVTIGENKRNRLGLDAMLDFDVQLSLGEAKLTQEELKQLMAAEEGLVYLKGQWIELDRSKLKEALAHWKRVEKKVGTDGISFIDGMRLLAGAPASLDDVNEDVQDEDRHWSFVNAGSWLSGVLAGLRNPNSLSQNGVSKNLKGTLRPYQEKGHDWLRFVTSLGLGACLADDMGLGKTIQVISLLLSIKEESNSPKRPSLLVLPASLLSNWKSEMERFAPSLSACFIHPSEKGDIDLSRVEGEGTKALANFDVVATTYGMLVRQSWLADVDWHLVILDEAQAIKNPASKQTRAVKKLKSQARIALTGTPVENRLSDLWSLFDFLSPGLLGSAEKFKSFVKKLADNTELGYAPLRSLVSPYILRRLKSDKSIISDLPDKSEVKVFCGLTQEQVALYTRSVEELTRLLKEVDGMQRRGLVLSFLLRFKQICNHPSQLVGDGQYDAGKSGKFDRLQAICEEIALRGEKVLVFTQFREMTDPISSFLEGVFGQPGLVLHGGTAVGKRKGIVETFQKPDGPPFVVLSLKAGGTGLNLTAASHVIHFDRWWNPAVENQATDRAYRIGQHRNVLVHKFICQGTIEEKIDKLIMDKTELAEGILTGGAESILTEKSDRELIEIVSLDLDRVSLD